MLCVSDQPVSAESVSIILRLTEHWGNLFMVCVSNQLISAESVSTILRLTV